ncbi:tRNA (adenosine(37)-N6)-threonylcarbamoyltransferase complex ATPase subunit type 1 TsaE [Arcobacteraceae bacterium]|nr:tRNA (adenosine(37)-N6)-threonylcarbamoyltransferase complex ATPase subunit type 1 TsaE [Arcobacteraceae bacterium]
MTLKLSEISQFSTVLKEKIDDKDIVVLLRGDLASGKTTLVQNFVSSLGIDNVVTSPTFSIQSIYGDDIYHYDVYNKTLNEFVALGLLEEFEKSGIHFVEWGDEKLENILKEYGFEVIVVNIEKNIESREYTIGS